MKKNVSVCLSSERDQTQPVMDNAKLHFNLTALLHFYIDLNAKNSVIIFINVNNIIH